MKRRHPYLARAAWLVSALMVVSAAAAVLAYNAIFAPYKGYAATAVRVKIPAGSSTASIAAALETGGVVRDRRLAMAATKLLFKGRTLKAGEYRFAGPRSTEQVLATIVAGDVVTYRVTVPEGLTAEEIFALFSSQGFGQAADYRALFAEPPERFGVPVAAPTLEGFLFPDTYSVTPSMTAREIVSTMVHQFRRRLPRSYEAEARKVGLDVLQAVTLASLVEKETSLAEERLVVAAVYLNRRGKGMLLQCDPTTIYSLKRLGQWRGTLARAELLVDDPYNTYVNPGLPPGPICNPGLAALRASVQPANVDYLYFVAAAGGAHRFARQYEDQQRNVALYLKERKEARQAPETP